MDAALVDLDAESRRALEFDAVLDDVASHAATALGAARVRALRPVYDAEWIEIEQSRVEEAGRLLGEHGAMVPAGLPDPTTALRALAVEGARVEAADLRDLAAVLVASADLRRLLVGLDGERYPRLEVLGAELPEIPEECAEVVRHVAPDGRVLDSASEELGRLRALVGRLTVRLRSMLEKLVRDPSADAVIRDEFVTQRNNRFVIPVRADAPRPVRGIVHAASSSGATLFVEPLASVELNNELVQVAEQEHEERERILRGWADGLRERLDDVVLAVENLARCDSLQARARFAEREGGARPEVADGGDLELIEVRHPLLSRRLRERAGACVPLTFRQRETDRVLLLSGPNAGGKTVALKTLGLVALMSQAGLPVTARAARLPRFRQVRADIGDHQSIQADLSTFSAHVRAVARFLEEASPPALFLFDEIGTGTEPAEGGALARALLEKLLRMNVTTVATTHQGSLKAWAFTTPGVLSAAMEFDMQRLRPTFRVLEGQAGVSAGLEMGSRLGLPRDLVERARELLGPDARATEAYLDRLRDRLAEASRAREDTERLREEIERERRRERARAEREMARIAREAERSMESALREVQELGRREVRALRDAEAREAARKRWARAERKIRRAVGSHRPGVPAGLDDRGPAGAPLEDVRPGMWVRVATLGRDGEVVEVVGRSARVRLGSAMFTVDRDDLAAPASAAPGDAPGKPPLPHLGGEGERDDEAMSLELVLIGRRVDEALPELDRFLDRAVVEGMDEVRVVHGHGSGRLRAAVRRHLRGHLLVRSHRPGGAGEGGDGATVVRLQSDSSSEPK